MHMPSGKVHLRIEMIVFIGLIGAGAYLLERGLVPAVYIGLFLASYLFSSLFLSPDLDLRGSDPYRRWGPARVLWRPYAHFFRHRALSHHIIYGPLTRIAYFGGLISLLFIGATYFTNWHVRMPIPRWPMIASILCGLYLPNQVHTLADALWSHHHRR